MLTNGAPVTPSQSTTAPESASVTETFETGASFGFDTLIWPDTTALRPTDPVWVTSTFHCTLPVSPVFISRWLLSTDFSTSQV